MIDWIAILYILSLVPLHELSHYLVMRTHSIKGKFKITPKWVGFEVKDWHIKVETPEDLNNVIYTLIQVYTAGCLLPTFFGVFLLILTSDWIIWPIMALELLYSIYEVNAMTPPVINMKEGKN